VGNCSEMLSILIPVLNNIEYTMQCLESIFECTDEPYEIWVCDNGSTDGTNDKLSGLAQVNLITNFTNRGYAASNNQMLQMSKGDWICLLNNDTVCTPHWNTRLMDHGKELDIIGPKTNSISPGIHQHYFGEIYNSKEELYRLANKFYYDNKGKFVRFGAIYGYCLMMKRKVYEVLQGLDEIYTWGGCEDDDFICRAIEVGFKSGIAEDVYIHHYGSKTIFNLEDVKGYHDNVSKNMKIFRERWPISKLLQLKEKNNGSN
jgi:O-antigen biosynthesis protein